MKSKKSTDEILIFKERGITLSRGHLSFMYVLITWPIIYLLCFVTRPEWIVNYNGYLLTFGGGSGTPNASSNPGFSNTILSDNGRENILWISFLFALLAGLLVYILLGYY